jgi:hypothetical protein
VLPKLGKTEKVPASFAKETTSSTHSWTLRDIMTFLPMRSLVFKPKDQ